jgi:tRNA nucleotidyltransferase/poly(A) polymerase
MPGAATAIPSLAGADWLAAERPVRDIDFATTALPAVVMQRAASAGFRVVPTGVDHGTVTLVAGHGSYEVTTLREDVETDGRHAVVRFGRDWRHDAERRDFTINALSLDARGTVHDPLGGYPDLLAHRIRFIGDADRRIAEDRLRILRFFRFNAQFGTGACDPDGLAAAIRARDGLRALSAERIGQEMRRLVVAPRAAPILALMQDCGVLPVILAGVAYLGPLARLLAFEAATGVVPSFPLRLAALGCRVEEDALRLAERLRLANAERDLMRDAVGAGRHVARTGDERAARRLLYETGTDVFRAAVALAAAWDGLGEATAVALHRLPDRWPIPRFPLSGRDALGAGARHGPAVGALLKALQAWWIAEDFAPDEATLRARLQQMIAAAQ